jgi:hypothetical protein
MSGGGGPTQTTVTQSNVPDWLRPQVETVLGGAMKELFQTREVPGVDGAPSTYEITGTKPFVPYSASPRDYVAGFSPLQQQVQFNAANLQVPQQFQQGTQFAQAAGMGGLDTAAQAAGYGQAGFQSGQMGQQLGLAAARQAEARARAAEQAGYGFGQAGFEAGQQGQRSGLLGQQLGITGGQRFGEMGAGYGAQAASLAPQMQAYGQLGYGSGALGQQLALQAAREYGGMGSGYGARAAAMAPEAQMYGRGAADIARMGLRAEELGRDITGQARGYAQQAAGIGDLYERMATSPAAYQQFMSPYQRMVTDLQIQAAQRQADIARAQRGSQAARAGAFGGARQAIENAEAQRALETQMQNIQAQGLQQAFQQAQANIAQRAQLGLQGLSGAQAGLGTALQGGQLGLSGIGQAMAGQQAGLAGLGQAGQLYGLGMQGAGMGLQAAQTGLAGTAQGMQGAGMGIQGLQGANQLYQTGIQGAGLGLQGTQAQLAGTAQGIQGAQAAMQGAGVGLSGVDRAIAAGQLGLQGADRGLAGTAQGMQGAQVGLQGVTGQQAGYGLANQAAGTLGSLGTQQLAAQTGILGLQNQIGAQQQAQEQQVINQAIQNYAQAQQAPMERMQQFNALLRGYALPGTTTAQYQAQPTLSNQLVGLGTAGIGAAQLSNALGKKSGGIIDLSLHDAMKEVA